MKILASNPVYEVAQYERDEWYKHEVKLTNHTKVEFDSRAHFAAKLVEQWGMVATDGPSARKAVLLTPEEVVARAVDIVNQCYEQFGAEGWLLTLPTLEELAGPPPYAPPAIPV